MAKRGRKSVPSIPTTRGTFPTSTSYSYRGKKRKSYGRKLTPNQVEQVQREAALRDFVRNEKLQGAKITYKQAVTSKKFQDALDTLERLKNAKRKTLKLKREATKALITLGRLNKTFKGVYF